MDPVEHLIRHEYKRRRESDALLLDLLYAQLAATLSLLLLLLRRRRRRRSAARLVLERPLIPARRLNFDKLPCAFTLWFRFTKDEVWTLLGALDKLPTWIVTRSRHRCHMIEGLLLVLRKLSYPIRYEELIQFFGRSTSGMSEIFRATLKEIHRQYGNLLAFDPRRFRHQLPEWSWRVYQKQLCFRWIALFLDGNLLGRCRPNPRRLIELLGLFTAEEIQNACYNGRKRHVLVVVVVVVVVVVGRGRLCQRTFVETNHDVAKACRYDTHTVLCLYSTTGNIWTTPSSLELQVVGGLTHTRVNSSRETHIRELGHSQSTCWGLQHPRTNTQHPRDLLSSPTLSIQLECARSRRER